MNMMNAMLPYLKTMQVCGLDTNLKCFADVTYKNLNGTNGMHPNNNTHYAKIRLADGTSAFFAVHSPTCTFTENGQCGVIIVDVNGIKPPNTIGKDYFRFQVTKNGIMPTGTQKDNNTTFEDRCVKQGADGWGCAAWVIYNENMDYLHCEDLSWDGKKKCN